MLKILLMLSATFSLYALEPVIVVLGPPGSGKGHFSQFFKEHCQYNHLSAGDILREEIDKKTPIGLQIEEIVKRGERIDAGIMQSLMAEHVLFLQQQKKPFVIDGFGGGEHDIKFLYELLSDLELAAQTFVVFLDADNEICKNRMMTRLVCSQCQHVYNMETHRAKVEGQCDLCSAALIQRVMDVPNVIENRLCLYRERVEPNYKKAVTFFPTLFFRTDGNLDHCTRFYRELSLQITTFEGDAAQFLPTVHCE